MRVSQHLNDKIGDSRKFRGRVEGEGEKKKKEEKRKEGRRDSQRKIRYVPNIAMWHPHASCNDWLRFPYFHCPIITGSE